MNGRQRLLLIVGVIVAIIVFVAAIIFVISRGTPQVYVPQPDDTTSVVGGDTTQNSVLQNPQDLSTIFTPDQLAFINQSIVSFAQNISVASSLHIDTTSIIQRDSTSYGFSVVDNTSGNNLMYVIVTKQPTGKVKVDCFIS